MNSVEYFLRQFERTFIDDQRYLLFLTGLRNTIIIALSAAIIGVIIGTGIALIKLYHTQTGRFKILERLLAVYVSIIRGTPLAVQLLIFAYIIIQSSNYVFIACIAFGLNSGAYVSELIRAGISAIDKGQTEAGLSLGLPRLAIFKLLIFPQAIKNILPALCNEFIMLFKETSIVGLIAVVDLTRASDLVRSRTMDAYFPLISIALIYFLIVSGLTLLSAGIEKRMARCDRS
ncbi:MAG: amino acid ABC transporter permease [Spirochaetaceae bacterium]|jgi:His/Glu/Gln/Arg/opine family amino acid ABC transporter permease subunit|nr:amino acid ABC transporter permease [Spirochaetaceae bacterium]